MPTKSLEKRSVPKHVTDSDSRSPPKIPDVPTATPSAPPKDICTNSNSTDGSKNIIIDNDKAQNHSIDVPLREKRQQKFYGNGSEITKKTVPVPFETQKSTGSPKKTDKTPTKSVVAQSKSNGTDLTSAVISSADSQDSCVGRENIIIDEIHTALLSKESSQIYRIINESRGVVGKIQTASTLWTRAAELAMLEFWRDPISNYVCPLIKEQLIEEDLFTDSTTLDLAAVIVELLGYCTVPTPSSTKLVQLQSSTSLPTDFLRLVLRVEPVATSEAVKSMFSCFGGYRLDRFLSDYLDDAILRSLSDSNGRIQHGRQDNKSIAVALTVAFEFEFAASTSTSTTAVQQNVTMEQRSALAPILSISPLVRLSPKHVIEQHAYFQDSLFANLPPFPAVTRLGCPNHPMETQQLKFVRSNLNRLQELIAAIFQRCLKVNRESVVCWVSRLTYLVHQQMHTVGRRRLLETKESEPWHSGFILNLAAVLLMLMNPLFSDPSKFLSLIDVEYVTAAARAKVMKGGPNIADGRIIGSQSDEHQDGPSTKSDMIASKSSSSSSSSPPSSPSGQRVDADKPPSHHKYNFPTEIFWLTYTTMELIDKINIIQEEFIHQTRAQFDAAKERYEATGDRADRAMEMQLSHLRKCFHGFYYGWLSSPLCDPHFLSLSCSWAHFAASFVRLQMSPLDQDGDQAVVKRLQCIPAGLLKAICSVWKRAAFGYYCMYIV